jgi:hypothetical protein
MSTFSATGPLKWVDAPARLGITLDEAGRVGRVIMLYHSLAISFVAALVYFILDLLPFEKQVLRQVPLPSPSAMRSVASKVWDSPTSARVGSLTGFSWWGCACCSTRVWCSAWGFHPGEVARGGTLCHDWSVWPSGLWRSTH